MNKPITTLFLLMSVDGKISTGDTDTMDFDKDLPTINEVKEGLKQYYDLEQKTDLFSLNSGKVLAKIGINTKTDIPKKTPVTFIIIDNQPHLNEKGILYLTQKAKELIIVTTNKSHPAYSSKEDNIKIIECEKKINFSQLFSKLNTDFKVNNLTIQTGGTINSILVRESLIDKLLLVIAPVLIGGQNTPSLIDGESIHLPEELSNLKALKLLKAEPLNNSYLKLEYEVINSPK